MTPAVSPALRLPKLPASRQLHVCFFASLYKGPRAVKRCHGAEPAGGPGTGGMQTARGKLSGPGRAGAAGPERGSRTGTEGASRGREGGAAAGPAPPGVSHRLAARAPSAPPQRLHVGAGRRPVREHGGERGRGTTSSRRPPRGFPWKRARREGMTSPGATAPLGGKLTRAVPCWGRARRVCPGRLAAACGRGNTGCPAPAGASADTFVNAAGPLRASPSSSAAPAVSAGSPAAQVAA